MEEEGRNKQAREGCKGNTREEGGIDRWMEAREEGGIDR